MEVGNVSVTRTYNLGNYENIKFHVEATVGMNEDGKTAMLQLDALIADYWLGRKRNLLQQAKAPEKWLLGKNDGSYDQPHTSAGRRATPYHTDQKEAK